MVEQIDDAGAVWIRTPWGRGTGVDGGEVFRVDADQFERWPARWCPRERVDPAAGVGGARAGARAARPGCRWALLRLLVEVVALAVLVPAVVIVRGPAGA